MIMKYPIKHLSIRVPWHDSKWNGTVCKGPKCNHSCQKLSRISGTKDDDAEQKIKGKSIEKISQEQWPPCFEERGAFMMPFDISKTDIDHPYRYSSTHTHGHIEKTNMMYKSYSAPAVPFRWMLLENTKALVEEFDLDVNLNQEPDLNFNASWVQEYHNQRALLDCFSGHLKTEASLCFFYAKQVPFVEDNRRVVIGVGRVKSIGELTEYQYNTTSPPLRTTLWERMIGHTIQDKMEDGFLLPYHEAIELSMTDQKFNPADIAVFAPEDRKLEFSYASEHVTHDAAISVLLSCAESIKKFKGKIKGNWNQCLQWIDEELSKLWKMRGPFPALGSVLSAYGLKKGTLIAMEVEDQLDEFDDPWVLMDNVFAHPDKYLSAELVDEIGTTFSQKWELTSSVEKEFLKLLSRFQITFDQAREIYQNVSNNNIYKSIIKDPYHLVELTRKHELPVSIWSIDRGTYPEDYIRENFPLDKPSKMDTDSDPRRLKAWTTEVLERASDQGHTLLSQKNIIESIQTLPIKPGCSVDSTLMKVAEQIFNEQLSITEMADDSAAYQLMRYTNCKAIINKTVFNRIKAKKIAVQADWPQLLEDELQPIQSGLPELELDREKKARKEKIAALEVLAKSRISVLIGPAGTGKTTLLKVLCSQEDIKSEGVLLLAPTGKARVRLESGMEREHIDAQTIAKFLVKSGRFKGKIQSYELNDSPPESIPQKTVIIDETSMLTEEMLAAFLQSSKGFKRLILVGDSRQLPPIGAGRPFVDIIKYIEKQDIQAFPKIGENYAELTIQRRQTGDTSSNGQLDDLQLASWFSTDFRTVFNRHNI